MTVLIVYG